MSLSNVLSLRLHFQSALSPPTLGCSLHPPTPIALRPRFSALHGNFLTAMCDVFSKLSVDRLHSSPPLGHGTGGAGLGLAGTATVVPP